MLADLRVLRGRSFRNLFASQAISLLGSAIAPVALAFAILDEHGGSPSDLGFVLAATIGSAWALAFDAGTFAAATALIIGIRADPADRKAPSTMLADLREGWQEFRSRSWVWLLVVQFAFVNGCWAAVMVLGPLLAKQYMGGAPAWAAVLTAMAVGLVSGSLVAIRLRPRYPLRTAAAATFGFLPPFLVLAFHAPVWLVAAAMLVNGVCVDIFEVLWATSLQTHVPNEALARISSYDMLGSFILGPLGLVAVGPVAAALGVRPTLIGACAILTAATIVPLLTSAVRDLPAEPETALAPAATA